MHFLIIKLKEILNKALNLKNIAAINEEFQQFLSNLKTAVKRVTSESDLRRTQRNCDIFWFLINAVFFD